MPSAGLLTDPYVLPEFGHEGGDRHALRNGGQLLNLFRGDEPERCGKP